MCRPSPGQLQPTPVHHFGCRSLCKDLVRVRVALSRNNLAFPHAFLHTVIYLHMYRTFLHTAEKTSNWT